MRSTTMARTLVEIAARSGRDEPGHPYRPATDPVGGPRRRGAAGQAMVLATVLLSLLLVPLGLVALEAHAQVETYRQVQAVVQAAADDAAGTLDDAGLVAGAVRLDPLAAQRRASQTLRQGLAGYGRRVAAARTVLTVVSEEPPTVCFAADVTIGVLVHDGLGWTYHLAACARSAVPRP